jgi:glycosyltransferase involved in cell wall biosynthesis
MSSISLVVRTRNHAWCIAETLRRLAEQDGLKGLVAETVHIDLGSTDGTLGILRRHQPEKLVQLDADRFSEGASLNLALRTSHGPWVVLISGDALPADERWLRQLVTDVRMHPDAAAVTSRQLPRKGCRDVYAHGLVQRFGAGSGSRLLGGHHSAVAIAINRAVWERQPFREDLPASEMEEWASRVERLGWEVRLADGSRVVFGRNYTLAEVYRQARREALAWSRIDGGARSSADRPAGRARWRGRNLRAFARLCWMDLKYSFEKGNVLEWPYSIAVQLARRVGERQGYAEAARLGARDATRMPAAELGSYAGIQARPR